MRRGTDQFTAAAGGAERRVNRPSELLLHLHPFFWLTAVFGYRAVIIKRAPR